MFDFTNVILEKNRAEQAISAGQVTGSNINKIIGSGGARGLQTHVAGLETGTKNIYNQNNVKEVNDFTGQVSPVTNSKRTISVTKGWGDIWGKNPRVTKAEHEVHVPKANSESIFGRIYSRFRSSKPLNAVVRRHEGDEARDKSLTNGIFYNKNDDNRIVGRHASPKVLQREADHVNYLSKLDPGIERFRQDRVKSGEYSPEILNMSNAKMRRMDRRKDEFAYEMKPETGYALNGAPPSLGTRMARAIGQPIGNAVRGIISRFRK